MTHPIEAVEGAGCPSASARRRERDLRVPLENLTRTDLCATSHRERICGIHAVGSCTPTFAAAGGHYNPFTREHGLDNANGPHAGDLPNLEVNVAGRGHLDAVSHHATLSGGPVSLFDADGSAIVIHANEDDQVTNPTGNSGARIACGVIEAG